MSLFKDISSFPAALRLILGAGAALGLVVFIAQIPPGTISEAAPTNISRAQDELQVTAHLSTADEAACGLIQRALLRVARGMQFERALTYYAFVPWPEGAPSSSVRAVFNSFERATSLQRNYMHGEGSEQAAAEAFNSSVTAYADICEVGT
ncbi:MAG: hypothetical protein Q7K25_11720 [Actinomycetota bacterium]|nr:hypothetical protein [Actinomycetota bacterium]